MRRLIARFLGSPWTVGITVFLALTFLSGPLIPPAVCRDGWHSPSIGHRGACSHHGGVGGASWQGWLALILSVGGGIVAGRMVKRNERNDRLDETQSAVAAQQRAIANEQAYRDHPIKWNAPPTTSPACPTCGGTMRLRTAKRGRSAGSSFWGCTKYPRCKGTRTV